MRNAKSKSKANPWPRIKARGDSFEVDCGRKFGTRRRRSFKSEAEAEVYAEDCRRELQEKRAIDRNVERNRSVHLANLNDTQRAEVIQAYGLLGSNHGLVEAVQFYLKHTRPNGDSMTLADLHAAFVESKVKTNKRPRSIRNATTFPAYFVADREERPAHSITSAEVQRYLDDRCETPSTFNTHRIHLLGLFNYAIKLGVLDRNPVSAIDKRDEDETEPTVFNVSETRKLLATAQALHPDMIPYLTVGLFAGLRPENELTQLSWSAIDLRRLKIKVEAATAKKRRSRYVDVAPNLAKWLAPHQREDGSIYYSRRKLRAIVEAAGLKWSQDVMRHSFGSHHLAAHDNAPLTARQLGHAGQTDVLFAHYAALVERDEGKAFFHIEPKPSKVIRLRESA